MDFPSTPSIRPCKRGHTELRTKFGICPSCRRVLSKKSRTENPEKIMLWDARRRAKEQECLCTITLADIVIPEFCPVFGTKLEQKTGVRASSPSLDKIKPELGYVPGNVWVISHRANTIKNDATLQELEILIRKLKEKTKMPWENQ